MYLNNYIIICWFMTLKNDEKYDYLNQKCLKNMYICDKIMI